MAARVLAPPHSFPFVLQGVCTQVVCRAHRPDGAPQHVHDRVLQIIGYRDQGIDRIGGVSGLHPVCTARSTAPEHCMCRRAIEDQAHRAVQAGGTKVCFDHPQGRFQRFDPGFLLHTKIMTDPRSTQVWRRRQLRDIHGMMCCRAAAPRRFAQVK